MSKSHRDFESILAKAPRPLTGNRYERDGAVYNAWFVPAKGMYVVVDHEAHTTWFGKEDFDLLFTALD